MGSSATNGATSAGNSVPDIFSLQVTHLATNSISMLRRHRISAARSSFACSFDGSSRRPATTQKQPPCCSHSHPTFHVKVSNAPEVCWPVLLCMLCCGYGARRHKSSPLLLRAAATDKLPLLLAGNELHRRRREETAEGIAWGRDAAGPLPAWCWLTRGFIVTMKLSSIFGGCNFKIGDTGRMLVGGCAGCCTCCCARTLTKLLTNLVSSVGSISPIAEARNISCFSCKQYLG